MPFDIDGARSAGYSDAEIANFLGSQSGFDVDGALKSGYQPSEVVDFLANIKDRGPADETDPLLRVAPTTSGGVNPTFTATPAGSGRGPMVNDRVSNELGQLRDEFFSGVDSAVAGVKTINTGIQMRRLQETEAEAKRLEERGQPLYARQMRGEAQSLKERIPLTAGKAAEAQATAQRGAQMATRPVVQKMGAAKTLGDAWAAFKEDPYGAIAGITAQSMPAMLPALVAGAVAGPVAGAVAMGGSSGVVEFGSSLSDFARDAGVNVADPKALEAFYADPATLSEALSYAGKRAGVIAALDTASAGIAGKVLAPPLKSAIARQAVNVPAQMVAQAAAGAGGEAGAQLVTKGEIDQPGQVLMEAVGEFGGAPLEVAAFGRNAVRAAPERDPTPDILAAPTIDAAIAAAEAAVRVPVDVPTAAIGAALDASVRAVPAAGQAGVASPEAEQAVENIGRILQSQAAAQPVAEPAVAVPPAGAAPDAPNEQQQAVERAGALDTPTAMELALQRAQITPESVRQAPTTQEAADVSNSVEAPGAVPSGVDGRGADLGGSEPAGGLGDGGRGAAAEPERSGGADVAVGRGAQQPAAVEPQATWFGRRGDGYLTEGDAQMAIPSRQRVNPDLRWAVERMPSGKFRLAGYASAAVKSQDASAQTQAPQAAATAPVAEAVPSDAGTQPAAASAARSVPAQVTQTPPPSGVAVSAPAAAPTERERINTMVRKSQQRRDNLTPNPFKTFLIRNGLALRLAREFAPGTRERLAMGHTFRNGGLELDALAERAAEQGYIRDRMDTDELYALIAKVASGERVAPMYGQDAEAEMAAIVDRQRALEEDAAEAVAALPDETRDVLDDVPWDEPSNVGPAEAMRALGFSEQEIRDATATGQDRAQEAGAGDRRAVEAAGGQAQADSGQGPGPAREEGLTAPTPADVIAQQDRAAQAERAESQRKKDEEARAKADAQRDEFTLSGSDRAADANPDQGSIFALRASDEDASIPYEEVEQIVDELTAKWQNRPDIRVLDSMSEAPPAVLKTYLEQRSQGAAGRIHGFHLKGTVYLVADSMRTREDVEEVLFHEVAHFGMRALFGDMLRPMLADVLLGQRAQVIAKAKAYGLDMNKQADRLMAAEEVLAELAQVRPELGVIRRLVAAIRTWLRDNIPAFAKMKMTDDELIRKFIIPARGFVERGQSTRPTFTIMGDEGPETVFSLGDNPSVTDWTKHTDEWGTYRKFGDAIDVSNNWKRFASLPDDQRVIFYHATGEGAARAILREGFDGGKAIWKDSKAGFVYMGGMSNGGSLGTYSARATKPGERSAFVAFAVRKGDVQPDNGTDWKSYLKRYGNDVDRLHGKAARANPSAVVTFSEINQVRAPVEAVTPVAVFDDGGNVIAQADPEDNRVQFSLRSAVAEDAEATAPDLSPWRDATGRLQFAPGVWLYDKLGDLASPLLAKMGLKAASPELRRQLRTMKLAVQKAQETAAAVAGEAMKLSEDERGMVSDLIEQELAAGTVPPAHAVRLAAMINESMGAQTDELVRLGMLNKDSAELWRGKYLPRYYKSKLTKQIGDAWADALYQLRGRQKVMAGIKGKHLKGRGLYETVAASAVAEWEDLGWEVRDQDHPKADASEISRKILDGEIAPEDTVQVWRDFTREERDKMGEIRDAGFRFVMGYMQTQRDIALGRMFEGLANDPEMSAKRESERFNVQVPDGTVPGTGAKRYGKLAGRWVPKEVMSHLSQIDESQSEAWRMYRKALAIWKEGKTALNPVAHVNNMVSNLTMAHLAGVSYHRADKYIAAARDFATQSPRIKEAKDAGLFLGTMSDAELMNVLPEDLKALVRQQDSAATRIGRTGFNVMTFWLRRPMGWAYQAEDTFFRYLIWKDATDRGMSPEDAVDHAQRYIFAYDDLPKGARMIRDFGIPFFSYTYKAAPALLYSALAHPVRMAAPAAVLWGINAAAYAIAVGDDDDSWERAIRRYLTDAAYREEARKKEKLERELLPSWNKGTTALGTPKMIRLGMDEVTKLPLFIDVSRIIPGGDLFDVSPNAGGVPLPQPITPSHPLFTTAVAMIGNKDMFRGKEIVDKNDTRGEATEKRLEWLWTQVSPAVAAGSYHWDRTMNAIAQASGGEVEWLPEVVADKYTGIGRDGLPVQPKYAAMQTFGIKVRPMDLEKSEAIDRSMQNKMMREIDAEMRSLQRLNNLGAVSDRTYEKARELADTKKDRIREGKTVDGEDKD